MVADLYYDVLLDTSTTVMPGKPSIKFLGKNEKNILVVVNHAGVPFLPDDELKFLTSVLSACKLSLADVAIVNWREVATKEYSAVFEELNGNRILLFDVSPSEFGLPLSFPFFQVQPFDNRNYLCAPALTGIEKDVETKKQLWASLKRIFAI